MMNHVRLQYHVTTNKNKITPSRYAAAVTSLYADSMGITFLFSHQWGRIFSRYDMVEVVARYPSWANWPRRFFVLVALLAEEHKVSIYSVSFTLINLSLSYIITIWLQFPHANTFCLRWRRRTKWNSDINPTPCLTLIVLMWRIGWAHNNARK